MQAILIVCTLLAAGLLIDYNQAAVAAAAAPAAPEAAPSAAGQRILSIVKRSHDKHHSMVHNHLSRKVFDRACAASKDTIDEILACITNNEAITKAVKPEIATGCHKEAFGIDFDPKDLAKHKEMICNNREKFENMTACVYHKMAESIDSKEMEKLAEAMVDVGLCIINALDG